MTFDWTYWLGCKFSISRITPLSCNLAAEYFTVPTTFSSLFRLNGFLLRLNVKFEIKLEIISVAEVVNLPFFAIKTFQTSLHVFVIKSDLLLQKTMFFLQDSMHLMQVDELLLAPLSMLALISYVLGYFAHDDLIAVCRWKRFHSLQLAQILSHLFFHALQRHVVTWVRV